MGGVDRTLQHTGCGAVGNATFGIAVATTWTQINTPPATTLPCSMSSTHEHKPGDPAPETGHHEELNVFGSHTGKVVHAIEGEPLPGAPRSFTWRRVVREEG